MPRTPPSDFREGMSRRRLERVKQVLLIVSGKGGVGKSLVSVTLASLLKSEGFSVGLLDGDIYGPSAALLFGARSRPREGRSGLVPPSIRGIRVMSLDLFAPGEPVPLTGGGAREVVSEMLALTDWGPLDYLVVDMPPATGDILMLLTTIRGARVSAIVVTTPERLSLAVAHRTLQLLVTGGVSVAGVLGNMHSRPEVPRGIEEDGPSRLAGEFEVPFLGSLPYDVRALSAAERSDIDALARTRFAEALLKSARAGLLPGSLSASRAREG